MHKRRFFWLSVFSLYIYSLSAFAIEPLIAAGTYVNVSDQRPLLALFNDKDKQWHYPSSVYKNPLPENYSTGSRLLSVACKEENCVAVGYYYDTNTYSLPLIAISKNAGEEWIYMPSANFERMVNKGQLEKVACNQHTCFGVGFYEDQKRLDNPLLAIGFDNWSYPKNIINKSLPKNFHEGRFKDIQCTDKFCLAVGFYKDAKYMIFPLVMHTSDNGKHWQKPLTKKQLPKDFVTGYFNKAYCKETFCLMSGVYSDKKALSKPWIMVSEDGGKNWQSPELPLPDDFIRGVFVDIHCKNHFCIAVGNYNNVDTTAPLLLYSNDEGKHWLYSEEVNLTELPPGLEDGEFKQAACGENACIAVGSFHDRIGAHPLIAVSDDKGKTWSYPKSALDSLPNADVGDGELAAASCREDSCVAIGNYLTNDTCFPLLAMSNDKGKTWIFNAEIADRSHLPPGFIFGEFHAVN